MIEGLKKQTTLEGSLVYPKKKKIKEVLSTLTYCKGYVILQNGEKHEAPLKARWIERRYGKFRVFVDTKKFKPKEIKEVFIQID